MQLPCIVAVILGVFEFVACYEIWSKDFKDQSNALIPDNFFDQHSSKVIWIAYILTLGLQRLTWSVGNFVQYRNKDGNAALFEAFTGYICLVATHLVESWMWWQLALSPHYNTQGLSPKELLTLCIKFEANGGPLTSILLLGVPSLVIFFIFTSFPKPRYSKSKEL